MPGPKPRFEAVAIERDPGAVEMLDEAAALLRRVPFPIFSVYLLGTLPFWLGVIYFYFDMTQSAAADAHLVPGALLLTVLYFWMKTCQAVFARKVLALLEGGDPQPWPLSRWLRTALLQAIVAGSLPFVYPLALMVTVPFAWVNAFYHNFSAVGADAKSTLGESISEAVSLARLWPKQNHLMLGITWLAALVLFFNLAVLLYALPGLLNSLLGIETVFDQSLSALSNSTFYLSLFVLCYLLLNPLNKVVFALRCFHGRSRQSGADLLAELRRCDRTAARAGLMACAAFFLLVSPARADPSSAPAAAGSAPAQADAVPPAELDQAIERTLHKDGFAWRLPREEIAVAGSKPGFWARIYNYLEKDVRALWHAIKKPVEKFFRWLFKGSRNHDASGSGAAGSFALPWGLLILIVAVVALATLLILAFNRWQARRAPPVPLNAALPLRTVDLADERVQADELPEDSWIEMAQQLLEKGDLRLALRAFYLATLATLARQELIRLAPAKSNRDYLAELVRRLRGEVQIVPSFRESVKLFEASWYGTHDVTDGVIETVRGNQQRIRHHATA